MFRFLSALLPFLLLQQAPPVGDPPAGDPPKPEDKPKVEFTAEQQARVNDIEAKARKDAEDRVRAEVKAEAGKQATKDKEQRDRDEAEKRGEFDTVKAGLEEKVTKVEADLTTITAERDEYRTLVKAAWKDIPEKVRKTYTGEDDDVLAKKRHMVLMAELIAELTEKKEPKRGAGFDPPPTDRKSTSDEDNRARAAMRPRL